jgi:hypothetical protein
MLCTGVGRIARPCPRGGGVALCSGVGVAEEGLTDPDPDPVTVAVAKARVISLKASVIGASVGFEGSTVGLWRELSYSP